MVAQKRADSGRAPLSQFHSGRKANCHSPSRLMSHTPPASIMEVSSPLRRRSLISDDLQSGKGIAARRRVGEETGALIFLRTGVKCEGREIIADGIWKAFVRTKQSAQRIRRARELAA